MKIFQRIPIRIRISFGLVGLMVGSLLVASAAGFFPNEQEEILRGRAKLCETLAISGTAMASSGQIDNLNVTLASIVHRDPQVVSIGLRSRDGNMIVSAGPHEQRWNPGLENGMDQMHVPVFRYGERWGELQITFESTGGILGLNYWAPAWLLIVLVPACFLQFSFFLRKTLESLDPSGAVPTHVEKAFDTFTVGLFLLNSRGRIIFSNQRLATLLNIESSKLLGMKLRELEWIVPDDSTGELPWDQAKRSGESVLDQIIQFDVADRRLTFSLNCTPIAGQGYLVTFDDITLIEENKLALAEARDAAQNASEAKSAFLANMSHEIRTPLNAVLGFTDVLRRGLVSDSEEAIGHLNMIHTSGAHLLELINDILDLSKIEAGRLQCESIETQLDLIVEDVANVLNVRAHEKGIALRTEFKSAIPKMIHTDPTRLRQVITNLVGNAIKFTDEGEVTIVTKMIGSEDTSPQIQIDVNDSGIGMTPEQQSKIFESFVQADSTTTRKFGGTGLGLSISRRLAEAMGGQLTVASEAGVGSTFTISIPVNANSSQEWLTPEQIQSGAAKRAANDSAGGLIRLPNKPILVVDDGDANRRLIELVLSRAGAVVSSAENGLEAIKAVSENDYSIILMDMQMPVLDGYTATRRLREAGLTTPIIALTGNAMKGDREKCMDAGCDDFLTKPVDIDNLLVCVSSYIGTGESSPDEPQTTEVNALVQPAAPLASSDSVRFDAPSAIHPTLPMDDEDFRAITTDFIHRLGSRLDQIEIAIKANDFETVRSDAHWLKGAGGTVGLPAFNEPAKSLEEASKVSDVERAEELLTQIRDIHSRVVIPGMPQAPAADSNTPLPTKPTSDSTEISCTMESDEHPIYSSLPLDDAEFCAIIIDFVTKLDTRLLEMQNLLESNSFVELSERAHWLKGAGGTVGYGDFTEPAAELVSASRGCDFEHSEHLLRQIQAIRKRLVVPKIEVAHSPQEPLDAPHNCEPI
ncbi:Autoinducer 2 sensor kinase/phosphatase LuxQ [Planctomycetes bacterium CA13]|uniref:histidine kinase n=1 Tax=Novipirellula herctigrandis TaxID=2527986 RepID=A0A5C5YNS3_9BACT|nr:Autoinducer 2 sensor kinase/phosphatase LuxQ [Planctomycetes bacterium CA13]